MHRFLLSHQKELTDPALDALHAATTEKLTSFGQPFTLTLARDEWKANFEKCGGWTEWIERIVNGRDFATGEPYYTGFVQAGRVLGKASAQLLYGALFVRKPVAVIEWSGSAWVLSDASRVVKVRDGDFKAGWEVW